ncbi:MAG TPA: CoA transferase [Micromonosporaceae bacterium]|jgi:crotonobetainyl-CoA:carnitine CoA-transferase CaiB-like acyl-CoA transferase
MTGGPLSGVRVVDLTMAWAGPMTTRVLAQLGADVTKVEAAGKMDRWRGGTFVQRGTERYPDHDPGERPWNRNAYFNTQNVNKRSLVIDLKSPEGHDIIIDLIRRADVVTENFAYGAMKRLGLDYASLAEIRPGLVMLSMPGFGSSGPERDYIAHGPTIEQLAGNAYLQGYPDGPPLASGRLAWGDPVAGMTAAALLMIALWRRHTTGAGGHIDLAQLEAGVLFNFDSILDGINGGTVATRRGTGHAVLSPHGTYRCAGEDRWVAIACRDSTDWQRLREVVGADSIAGPEYDDLTARRDAAEHIDKVIGEWARGMDATAAAQALQARDVPASAVLSAADLLTDEQLRRRGYFLDITHPEAGRHRYAGLPWQYRSGPAWWRDVRPAPSFGEHNAAVLAEIGISPERISQLADDGVIAAEPVQQGD